MSGMKSTESNTDSTTTPKTDAATGYEAPAENITEDPKTGEPELDENGYEKVEAKVDPTPEPKVEAKEADPVEDKATGYGEDDKATEDKPDDKVKAPEAKEELTEDDEKKLRDEIIVAVHELPKENQEAISKFALDNKLTPVQVKAYAEIVKQEHADIENARKITKQNWVTELKTDPEFGGENFARNVDRAEKVLDKYMPNMKKVLTGGGTMLPPYIMKDLLALSKTLNPTTKLVNGEAGTVAEEKGNFLEEMYQ